MKKILISVATTLALGVPAAQAQEFPEKLVRIVVPYAAGGSADVSARIVARLMEKEFRKPVVAENKPGAGTLIGTCQVARALADGHTLISTTPTIPTNTLAYKDPGYKMSDFSAVCTLYSQPFIRSVHSALPVHNLQELLSYARTRPQGLNSGSLGVSAITTLSLASGSSTPLRFRP